MGVRTVDEVAFALNYMDGLLIRNRSIRFFHGGKWKPPTQAAVVSALILHAARLPDADQVRLLAEGMDLVNAITRAAGDRDRDAAPPDPDRPPHQGREPELKEITVKPGGARRAGPKGGGKAAPGG